tara:strand:- start:4877 stop:6802 length:1926 start_codon:yes stop_codon:yes gene_type:complete
MSTTGHIIYIVEDDKKFAASLEEELNQAGYACRSFHDAASCIRQVGLNPPDLLIVDCLLPQMPGLEMVKQIQKDIEDIPVIFMSGIFTDKNFIKNALQETKAAAFLTKPFDIEELTEHLQRCLGGEVSEETQTGPSQIYLKSNLSPKELESFIESQDELHAFHLIKLLFSLMRCKWSGSLNLDEGDHHHEIDFHEGYIVSVRIKDPNSFFGRLLIDKNYLTPEELDLALKSPSKKRIGEKLVDANLISPHVIDMVNAEQMCLRLGLLFHDTSYQIKISKSETKESSSSIDQKMYAHYCIEWIATKLSPSWLEKFYMALSSNILLPGDQNQKVIEDIQTTFKNSEEVIKLCFDRNTIQQIVESPSFDPAHYLVIHSLCATSNLFFDGSQSHQVMTQKVGRLEKILADTEKQDYFQVLGISKKSRVAEVKRAYHDLAKIFHPDTVPPNVDQHYKDLVQKIFAKITLAYETLSDDKKREMYLKELETGQAKVRLQVESLFDEAYEHIKSRKYKKALPIFEKINQLLPPTSNIRLHWLWTRIQVINEHPDKKTELSAINDELNKIPPEDRHSSVYYFVKGIFQKLLGEKEQALGNLKHALSIDSSFLEAKRELNILQLSEDNKPIDIMNADLKDVVGHLFKKVTR